MQPGRWMIVITALLLCAATVYAADTRYVSDQLVITLREGMGNRYRVIRTLKTDTPMEVLSDEGRYLYVQLRNGVKGYVLKQYVSKKTPKTVKIARLKDEVDVLRKQLQQHNKSKSALEQQWQQMKQQLADKEQQLSAVNEELRQTKEQFARLQSKAQAVIQIDAERQHLKEELATVTDELEQLRNHSNILLKTAMIKWFLAGAGVLFVGWVAGKFSRRKKRGLGSF